MRLKDVNYSVKGKRADPFVGKSPETARTKVLLCNVSFYHFYQS